MIELYDISGYLQSVGSLIIIVACAYKFTQRQMCIKVLASYGVISVGFTILQEISGKVFEYRGLNEIGNGFVFFEALSFCLIFFLATENNSFKKIIQVLCISYVVWYAIAFLFFTSNSYSLIRSGRDLLMIINSILFFYYLLRNLPEADLLKFPMFWISASVLFFFSGTFFLSFLIDYIEEVLRDDTTGFWAFRNFFRFGFCLMLAYAGWLDLQRIRKKLILKS